MQYGIKHASNHEQTFISKQFTPTHGIGVIVRGEGVHGDGVINGRVSSTCEQQQ